MTMTGNPTSAVLGNNVTYTLTAKNLGPSSAASVLISDALPAGSTFVNAASGFTLSNNLVLFTEPSIAVGGSVTFTVTVGTGSFTTNQVPLTMTNVALVSSSSFDPNPGNNSATVTTRVDIARSAIIAAGATLVGGNFSPPNGFVNPGETVTNILALENVGNLSTTNLVATLLATNGVTPVGSASLSYGALAAGGGLGSNTFAFTATANGTGVMATLQLTDGSKNLGTVQFPFTFPTVASFSNTANIVIPDHGPGSLYPSTVNVSGVTGLTAKITVTLTNVNHTYPDDIDLLLVGPAGQTTLLESHAGGGDLLTNVSITFDDDAASFLPPSSQIVSGAYKPSQYGSVNFSNTFGGTITINTTNPPPFPPYGTNLAVFDGGDPNGNWNLYVFDSAVGDQGIIVGGWSLTVSSGQPVNLGGDLAITGTAAPSPVQTGSSLTYTFDITNNGPNLANSVTFSDTLPPNVQLVSSNATQGIFTANGGGAVTCLIGNLGVGTNVTITLAVTPTIPGMLVNQATVAATSGDLNQANNQVTLTTTATAPVADLGVSFASAPLPAVLGRNLTYTINVTNNGPNTALGVLLTNSLNGTFVPGDSFTSPLVGTPFATNGTVQCSLGDIAPGAGVAVTIVEVPNQTDEFTNLVSVGSFSTDPVPANNTASAVITVVNPAPNILPAGARMLSSIPASPSGSLAPGDQVTVSLSLTNNGSASTSNLIATLLSGNGVSSPQWSALLWRDGAGRRGCFQVFCLYGVGGERRGRRRHAAIAGRHQQFGHGGVQFQSARHQCICQLRRHQHTRSWRRQPLSFHHWHIRCRRGNYRSYTYPEQCEPYLPERHPGAPRGTLRPGHCIDWRRRRRFCRQQCGPYV